MANGDGGAAGVEETAQVATGVPGLDRLLNGGLRRGGLHVALGGPGAGKSVLAHQIGSHVIRGGGKVLYLTVLVETHQVLLSQARTFTFFDPAVVPGSFYYASLYPALARGGLTAVREEIGKMLTQHGPTLVILDGMHALKASAPSRLEHQRFMHEMEAQSNVSGATMLILTHPEGEISSDPTFTIADAIFHMRARDAGLRTVRLFKVEKLRGVGHVGGWHTFEITRDGVQLYARLESLVRGWEKHVASDSPASGPSAPLAGFDVDGLDEMMGGNLRRGTSTLVVGTPGSGKTLLGLAFLSAGARTGERGLFVGFHEPPDSLLEKADGVALPFREGIEDGLIRIHWRMPAEMNADAMAVQVLAMAEEHGITRLVIDALEDTRRAVIPPTRTIPFHVALINLLRERGVTTLLLEDLPQIVGLNFEMPTPEVAATMENAIHLRYVEYRSEMRRLITVLKVQARQHDHTLRDFHITDKGMRVGKPFDKTDTALTGVVLDG
jgi:circadian clock protein KaiC